MNNEKRGLRKNSTKEWIDEYKMNSRKTKLNMSDVNAIKKMKKMFSERKKLAKLEGVNNLRFLSAQEMARRTKLATQVMNQAKTIKEKNNKEIAKLSKEAKKYSLMNINMKSLNVAKAQVKKAKDIQNSAKKLGLKKLNSNFVKGALNLDDTRLQEALIKKKLQAMGVNNAWIDAYKKDRKIKTLTNNVFATAQRQLNMLKNEGVNTILVYLEQGEKMSKMNNLYLKPTEKEFAERYGINDKQASKDIRTVLEQLNSKNDTYKLRDPKFKKMVQTEVDKKYGGERVFGVFARAKKNAEKTIKQMSIKFQPGGRLNQSVVNKFLNELKISTTKDKVNSILANARREYNTRIPVQEKSNSSSGNNSGSSSGSNRGTSSGNNSGNNSGNHSGSSSGSNRGTSSGTSSGRGVRILGRARQAASQVRQAASQVRQAASRALARRSSDNVSQNPPKSSTNNNNNVYVNAQKSSTNNNNNVYVNAPLYKNSGRGVTSLFGRALRRRSRGQTTRKQPSVIKTSFKRQGTPVLTRKGTRRELKAASRQLRSTQGAFAAPKNTNVEKKARAYELGVAKKKARESINELGYLLGQKNNLKKAITTATTIQTVKTIMSRAKALNNREGQKPKTKTS